MKNGQNINIIVFLIICRIMGFFRLDVPEEPLILYGFIRASLFLHPLYFFNQNDNCSPVSSAESVAPAEGSVFVLYLVGFTNISSL